MTEIRSARRSALFLTFVAGVFAAVSVLFAGAAAAQGATYGAGGPVARGSGGSGYGVGGPVGLARTGARTDTELIVAGLAFVVGGALLMLSQPLRRRVRA